MSSGTTLPSWAVFVVVFATPVLAFLGALLGHVLGRRATKEADKRWHREETLRTMRWAAEMASDADQRRAEVGASALLALLAHSHLLRPEDETFIYRVTEAVLGGTLLVEAEASDVEEG